jgi:hypothetical protein
MNSEDALYGRIKNGVLTAPIWRPAAQGVASWLARALTEGLPEKRRPHTPLPVLPAARRAWQGMQPLIPKTCMECGRALSTKQRKFCSDVCSVSISGDSGSAARQASGRAHRLTPR